MEEGSCSLETQSLQIPSVAIVVRGTEDCPWGMGDLQIVTRERGTKVDPLSIWICVLAVSQERHFRDNHGGGF